MIIGTAGHIDHGKTTLVKALTGVDTDRLKEEKARGITLELGYAYVPLPEGPVLGFVDVPGHERLVHTMLAGATGIDFVLLVVAADDGVMPQSREHLAILELLGLTDGAVVLTKVDRVSPARRQEAQAEIAIWLASSPLATAPVFTVSSLTGEGIPELRAHLVQRALRATSRRTGGHFRLAVDRVFTLAGTGTVVTGTAHSGQVAVGDRLVISPQGLPVRVRSLHAQNQPAQHARGGQRIALNLAGVDKAEIRRGDWIVAPDAHHPARRFDARLRVLASAPRPLLSSTPVHLHLGSQDVLARLLPLDRDAIEPGGEGLVQIVPDRPVVGVHGDRFVLRDAAATCTLAGGVILDSEPPARHRRSAERISWLEAEAAPDALTALCAVSPLGLDLARFARNRNLRTEELAALVAATGLRRVQGPDVDWLTGSSQWQALCERVLTRLAAHHAQEPDALGPDRERLRRMSLPTVPRGLYRAVLDDLLASGRVVLTGAALHLPEHRVQLAPAEEALWGRLRPLLASEPFLPPRVRDIARAQLLEENKVRLLLKRVARTGQVCQVAHDHFFLTEAVAALADIVTAMAGDEGVTAAAFRDRIGTGRKLAIQILEYFDRSRLTRRVGDRHRLRTPI
ncbi:selenocysteine-specific translation elongation factor [Thiobacter aerophilum]|uniref:Selenocysteine-specific elongation factor n=1 Tax=Thiobacter aerophilum TaxID=3121275 RepID=A0ABV0EIV6_9BURK